MVIKIKVRKTRKKMAKKDREHEGGWGTCQGLFHGHGNFRS